MLLWIADRLCAEVGGELPDRAGPNSLGSPAGCHDDLPSQDESLVETLKRALAKVAASVGGADEATEATERAVGAALDGAERVIRGELATGESGQLVMLMPSFVFLVTLPIVSQDEAIHLSRRASELAEEALRS